jgi:hypothetical protein
MKIQRVDFKRFKEEVLLWESKGHEHVTSIKFDDEYNYMTIIVPDYVDPDIGYFMHVSDDMDWNMLEENPIKK